MVNTWLAIGLVGVELEKMSASSVNLVFIYRYRGRQRQPGKYSGPPFDLIPSASSDGHLMCSSKCRHMPTPMLESEQAPIATPASPSFFFLNMALAAFKKICVRVAATSILFPLWTCGMGAIHDTGGVIVLSSGETFVYAYSKYAYYIFPLQHPFMRDLSVKRDVRGRSTYGCTCEVCNVHEQCLLPGTTRSFLCSHP